MQRWFQVTPRFIARVALAELIAFAVAAYFCWLIPIFDGYWFVPAVMALSLPFAMIRARSEGPALLADDGSDGR